MWGRGKGGGGALGHVGTTQEDEDAFNGKHHGLLTSLGETLDLGDAVGCSLTLAGDVDDKLA